MPRKRFLVLLAVGFAVDRVITVENMFSLLRELVEGRRQVDVCGSSAISNHVEKVGRWRTGPRPPSRRGLTGS